jgi:hypothetical protein
MDPSMEWDYCEVPFCPETLHVISLVRPDGPLLDLGASLEDTVNALPAAFTYCMAVMTPAHTKPIRLGNLPDMYGDYNWFYLEMNVDTRPMHTVHSG